MIWDLLESGKKHGSSSIMLKNCKVLHIDLNDNPRSNYPLNGQVLKVTSLERDLGVLVDDS